MSRKRVHAAVVAALLTTMLSIPALTQGQTGTGATAPPGATTRPTPGAAPAAPSPAATAIAEAAAANKYVFLFFYRAEDEPTLAARKTFDVATEKLTDRAMSIAVNITDTRERALVSKYALARSPLPLVLALAPSGAITRAFSAKAIEKELETAFVSPAMQKCLKALQDRKMAFLCVQNDATEHNAEALAGVREFAADPQYGKTTEIIMLDPRDPAEETLLKQFEVDPQTPEAVTIFMAPPGTKIGTYKGATKLDALVAAAKKAGKGCDPKSGCCPPKKPASQPAKPEGAAQPGSTEKQP